MHWRRFVTCLGLLGQACTPQSSPIHQFTVDDERAIRHVDSAYVAAWLRDDTAAVLQTLAPDVVLMPAGQRPLATPNDIRAFWWPGDGTHTKILAFDRSTRSEVMATSPGYAGLIRSRSATRPARRRSTSAIDP